MNLKFVLILFLSFSFSASPSFAQQKPACEGVTDAQLLRNVQYMRSQLLCLDGNIARCATYIGAAGAAGAGVAMTVRALGLRSGGAAARTIRPVADGAACPVSQYKNSFWINSAYASLRVGCRMNLDLARQMIEANVIPDSISIDSQQAYDVIERIQKNDPELVRHIVDFYKTGKETRKLNTNQFNAHLEAAVIKYRPDLAGASQRRIYEAARGAELDRLTRIFVNFAQLADHASEHAAIAKPSGALGSTLNSMKGFKLPIEVIVNRDVDYRRGNDTLQLVRDLANGDRESINRSNYRAVFPTRLQTRVQNQDRDYFIRLLKQTKNEAELIRLLDSDIGKVWFPKGHGNIGPLREFIVSGVNSGVKAEMIPFLRSGIQRGVIRLGVIASSAIFTGVASAAESTPTGCGEGTSQYLHYPEGKCLNTWGYSAEFTRLLIQDDQTILRTVRSSVRQPKNDLCMALTFVPNHNQISQVRCERGQIRIFERQRPTTNETHEYSYSRTTGGAHIVRQKKSFLHMAAYIFPVKGSPPNFDPANNVTDMQVAARLPTLLRAYDCCNGISRACGPQWWVVRGSDLPPVRSSPTKGTH